VTIYSDKRLTMPRSITATIVAMTTVMILASTAEAAPSACNLVTKAEYKSILHQSVRMTAGDGITSCNVFVGQSKYANIIPNINPYNAKYIKNMLAHTKNLRREPSLGPVGYSYTDKTGTTSYTERHGRFVAFQPGFFDGGFKASRAQMVALAKKAYHRI